MYSIPKRFIEANEENSLNLILVKCTAKSKLNRQQAEKTIFRKLINQLVIVETLKTTEEQFEVKSILKTWTLFKNLREASKLINHQITHRKVFHWASREKVWLTMQPATVREVNPND